MEQVEERRPHPRPAPQAGAAAARRLRLRRLHRDEEDRRMAETAGMRLVPHVWGTAVVLAASLHVHAILPPSPPRNERYQPTFEFDRTLHPYRQAIVTQPIAHRPEIGRAS